jgi:hypothetical protein
MKHDRLVHIIQFVHFSKNDSATDKKDPKYGRICKLRNVSDFLNDAYSKYCAPSEYLIVDEFIVLLSGRINFRQYRLSQETQTIWNQNLRIM